MRFAARMNHCSPNRVDRAGATRGWRGGLTRAIINRHERQSSKLFPPNEKIVEGRAAIEKFWKAAMDSGIKTVELKTTEVEGLGESAAEVGSYTLYGKDGAAMDRGKYLMLWKRVDGAWKFDRDCWNSNQPASR
jgi:hypothetical protein